MPDYNSFVARWKELAEAEPSIGSFEHDNISSVNGNLNRSWPLFLLKPTNSEFNRYVAGSCNDEVIDTDFYVFDHYHQEEQKTKTLQAKWTELQQAGMIILDAFFNRNQNSYMIENNGRVFISRGHYDHNGKLVGVRFQLKTRMFYDSASNANLITELCQFDPVIVTNSDGSYNEELGAGATHILPDVNHTDTDGTTVARPAVTPFVATAINAISTEILNAQLAPSQLRELYPMIEMRSMPLGSTSYASEDAAARITGNEFDFFTLPTPNRFGNNNRFTNSLGGSIYNGSDGSLPNYVIDHLQRIWDGTDNNLAWYSEIVNVNSNWANSMLTVLNATELGFTDWFIPNLRQAQNMTYNHGNIAVFGFPPFNNSNINLFFWTSETVNAIDSNAYRMVNSCRIDFTAKTNTTNARYLMARKHTF